MFRLVIPVPESSVRYIRVGDPVEVQVPALNRSFPGKVARFSVDVQQDTRTMHTEVDVPNPDRLLMPGMYAETTLTLEAKDNVLAVPLEAVNHEGDQTTVYVVSPSRQGRGSGDNAGPANLHRRGSCLGPRGRRSGDRKRPQRP